MKKYNIGFICVHNSCRSQMAEAITKHKYAKYFNAYSAGTEIKDQINQDAVVVINKMYGIDMNENQKSKLITDIPNMDIIITMGCNVKCPYVDSLYREDFDLQDPTGSCEEVFLLTAKLIDEKINNLILRIRLKEIENLILEKKDI